MNKFKKKNSLIIRIILNYIFNLIILKHYSIELIFLIKVILIFKNLIYNFNRTNIFVKIFADILSIFPIYP